MPPTWSSPRQGREEDRLPALRLPGRPAREALQRAARHQARGSRAPSREGHAAQGPPRSEDAEEAQGLRRSHPSAHRAEPAAAGARVGPPRLLRSKMPKPLIQSTGRRKEAVARVRIRAGQGVITINKRPFDQYFPSATHQMLVSEPLKVTNTAEVYDIDATIDGGGVSGQAGALRLGVARALAELDPEQRVPLKRAGFLTRDAREKESKKYGLKKARKAPQYSKR